VSGYGVTKLSSDSKSAGPQRLSPEASTTLTPNHNHHYSYLPPTRQILILTGTLILPALFFTQALKCSTSDKSEDIWGLGCLAYVLLVGYAPFELSTPDEKKAAEGNEEKLGQLKAHDDVVLKKAMEGDVPYADLYWRRV